MSLNNIIFIKNLPQVDIHGLDRKAAEYYVNQFVEDCYLERKYLIKIIHGKGEKVLLKITHQTLKNNKKVKDFKTWTFNEGITIAELNEKD